MRNIWRDLFISLLIVTFIILIIFIVSYNKLSINKIIPQSEDYQMPEKMQNDMKEDRLEEAKEIVTTYYLDSSDLKKFEKTQEYKKGKANPFAETSEDPANTVSGGSNKTGTGSGSGSGYYKDTGTK